MMLDTEECEQTFAWLSRDTKDDMQHFTFSMLYKCNLHNQERKMLWLLVITKNYFTQEFLFCDKLQLSAQACTIRLVGYVYTPKILTICRDLPDSSYITSDFLEILYRTHLLGPSHVLALDKHSITGHMYQQESVTKMLKGKECEMLTHQ